MSTAKPQQDLSAAALQISACAVHAEALEDMLTEMAHVAVELTGAHSCDILLRDSTDSLILRASTSGPEFIGRVKIGRGIGLSGQALSNAQPLYIGQRAESQKGYAKYPGLEDQTSEALAVLPLPGPNRPLGVCLFRKTVEWNFDSKAKRLCETIAEAIGNAVAMYNRGYDAGTRTNRLGALSEVTKTIATSPYVEEILQLLVNLTAQQFNYRVCTVRLLDETGSELILRATQSKAKAYQRKRAIKLGESIAGKAIAENRPIIVPDVQVEEDYIGHDLAAEQGLRAMICVPMTLHDRTVGVLSCYTGETRDFPSDEIKALETLAKQAAVSIEHAKLQVRSTLMQEMHHRVKNNLQQVASLLRLQIRHTGDPMSTQALTDSLSRILAIASVHDLLSREDLDHVGMRSIAEALVQHQKTSLVLPNRQINFEVRGDDVRLNINQATQVALVLNELIQNAVEHGFQDTYTGDIHVTVEERDGEVSVWVSNNGDQLPPDFDHTKQSHLGLQIVDNLSRALGGHFKIEDILGWTVAEVKFMRASGE